MEFERARRRNVRIGLIPLIDVTMFLLIFFLVSGTVEKIDVVPITPPRAESGKTLDEGHVQILLGAHDEMVLGDELMTLEELTTKITAQLAANPNKVITIKADASVPAARVITLMEAIRGAGGKNLSLMTQSGKKK